MARFPISAYSNSNKTIAKERASYTCWKYGTYPKYMKGSSLIRR